MCDQKFIKAAVGRSLKHDMQHRFSSWRIRLKGASAISIFVFCYAMFVIGCGPDAGDDCYLASAFVNQCLGKEITQNELACEAAEHQSAQRILELSCKDIKRLSESEKADNLILALWCKLHKYPRTFRKVEGIESFRCSSMEGGIWKMGVLYTYNVYLVERCGAKPVRIGTEHENTCNDSF